MRVHFRTLGCKVNRVESDRFATDLMAMGTTLADIDEAAVVVINTCTVTGEADAKARKAVRQALKAARRPVVVVTGCLAALDAKGLREIDARVVVEAVDRAGQSYRATATGYKARAIQHEIDHLDGILFLDHLSAVKRGLLLAKWKKARKGKSGFLKEVTPEPAGEL